MSRRLLSFTGQGSVVSADRLQHWASNVSTFSDADLIHRFSQSLEQPATIAACSNLLYRGWLTEQKNGSENGSTYVVGHSLGELNALNASVNGLAFRCKDIMEIASFRNKLMVEATQRYLKERRIADGTFEMWVVTNPRSKGLRKELTALLQDDSFNSPVPGLTGIKLANDNAPNQCVITGITGDIIAFVKKCTIEKIRHKFTKLNNPFSIPFHNNDVLRPIQEPLYDFIWQTLKENGKQHFINETVENGIISNVDGRLTDQFHTAIEKFVLGSSNIVNFVDCFKTIASELELDEAYHFGPGASIGKIIERNLKNCDMSHTFVD
ncbi:unnamed protein product [Kluyveromyces dobzhanskii CBS 2104]|uniref:[acyl-carrier-protein] S-malonyltransferase n=1 Tax=Kluyveromyces dobzhanskii CBS 2104 TaxID=1427455 RepID=A0A0A8L5T1_9SACH|nr:unnamed protein product [Kluyveromyces dobzhanskii CBS 2104]